MSHELRTPLNAMLGYTELILDDVYGERPDKTRDVLNACTQRQASPRPDQRRARPLQDRSRSTDARSCRLLDAGRGCRRGSGGEVACKRRRTLALTVGLNPTSRAPWRRAQAYPGAAQPRRQRHQIHRRGEVAITAAATNGTITVSVRDSGPGITETDQAKIFQEFQQADVAITREGWDRGLGLDDLEAHCRVAWGPDSVC